MVISFVYEVSSTMKSKRNHDSYLTDSSPYFIMINNIYIKINNTDTWNYSSTHFLFSIINLGTKSMKRNERKKKFQFIFKENNKPVVTP